MKGPLEISGGPFVFGLPQRLGTSRKRVSRLSRLTARDALAVCAHDIRTSSNPGGVRKV
jgi:hypothetical protein